MIAGYEESKARQHCDVGRTRGHVNTSAEVDLGVWGALEIYTEIVIGLRAFQESLIYMFSSVLSGSICCTRTRTRTVRMLCIGSRLGRGPVSVKGHSNMNEATVFSSYASVRKELEDGMTWRMQVTRQPIRVGSFGCIPEEGSFQARAANPVCSRSARTAFPSE